jgi:hypothetical protein
MLIDEQVEAFDTLRDLHANAPQTLADIPSRAAEITTRLTADDRATAVVHAQSAQEAISQASTLLNALDHADADIAAAPERIAERLASLGQDLDDVAVWHPPSRPSNQRPPQPGRRSPMSDKPITTPSRPCGSSRPLRPRRPASH